MSNVFFSPILSQNSFIYHWLMIFNSFVQKIILKNRVGFSIVLFPTQNKQLIFSTNKNISHFKPFKQFHINGNPLILGFIILFNNLRSFVLLSVSSNDVYFISIQKSEGRHSIFNSIGYFFPFVSIYIVSFTFVQ